jgi:hypothetical protein
LTRSIVTSARDVAAQFRKRADKQIIILSKGGE